MTQNWAELLNLIYTHDQKWEYFDEGDEGIDGTHPFVERTELNRHEAKSALSFLKRHELVEHTGAHYQLSEKGFNVAREREAERRQKRHDQGLLFLTVVLAFASLGQFLIGSSVPNDMVSGGAVGLTVFAILVFIFAVPSIDN